MITVIAVGKPKQDFLKYGIDFYKERLSYVEKSRLIIVKKEDDILSRKKGLLVLCDQKGQELTSRKLADFIKKKSLSNDLTFAIGPAEGFSDKLKSKADKLISLSKMTFTHEMALLFLLEQLYRAKMILKGSKYHK